MFDRFDQATRRILFRSKFHAAAVGESYIEPEHLLSGLLREGDATTLRIMNELKVDIAALERDCGIIDLPAERTADPRLSPLARKIVACAAAVAEELGFASVAPCCLLIALTRHVESGPAKRLRTYGVDDDKVAQLAHALRSRA
ncbi:MAG TPA: Clp protease N-terminal domain-containing protein [Thermoanaerobaculia bacterium]